MRMILASGSPRRIDMLREAGYTPEVVIPQADESIHLDMTPAQMVMCLALRKALDAERRAELSVSRSEPALLIAADTIVYAGRVIGKPLSERDAFETLCALRGRAHDVYSGVCLSLPASGLRRVFSCRTRVEFTDYSDEDIRRYIATGEPMDKAGSYAIQGGFAPYIRHLDGPRDNVIGFPMQAIGAELKALGLSLNTQGTGASETE